MQISENRERKIWKPKKGEENKCKPKKKQRKLKKKKGENVYIEKKRKPKKSEQTKENVRKPCITIETKKHATIKGWLSRALARGETELCVATGDL